MSFNIQGVTGNGFYLDELLKNVHSPVDIVCLQEHWLLAFEKKKLNSINGQFTSFTRSIDDAVPISPVQRPRGYGGIAILIKKSLMSSATKLQDGSERIQAVEIKSAAQHKPVIIINVYMPSRGQGTPSEVYSPVLEELSELVTKFANSHEIIICGDFNASFNRGYADSQDILFMKFCKEFKLRTPADTPVKDTFHHARGTSQIDHFIVQEGSSLLSNVKLRNFLQAIHPTMSRYLQSYLSICPWPVTRKVLQQTL